MQLLEALGKRDHAAVTEAGTSLCIPTVVDEYFDGDAAPLAQLLRAGVLRVMPSNTESTGQPKLQQSLTLKCKTAVVHRTVSHVHVGSQYSSLRILFWFGPHQKKRHSIRKSA